MKNGKMKILVTESENFSPEASKMLANHYEVDQKDIQSIEELGTLIPNYDVLFVRLRFKFNEELLSKGKKLKFILTATTGLDHIDVSYFEKKGGKIISLKGQSAFLETIPSTAEHTWALLLSLVKKIPTSFNNVKEGKWTRDQFKGHNLKGMKLGILGLGRIGSQVARFGQAFGMDVSYYDIVPKRSAMNSFKSPELLFSWADIICIHIPGDDQNRGFISYKLIESCKSGILLINTSRGSVWDEHAITDFLLRRHLGGIATDVLSSEFDSDSIINNPLVKLAINNENVIITPHIAGATFESMTMTENFIVKTFLKQLQ